MSYIYEISINEYKYVGSTKNKRKRKSSHLRLLKLNKHFNKIMQNVYNKHSDYTFTILEECLTHDEMKEKEEVYIKQYKQSYNNLCMNLLDTYGGGSEWRKYKTPEELYEHDRKRTQLPPEQRLIMTRKRLETVNNTPIEERQEWYDRAKETRAKNIKTRKNYNPIHILIIFPDGTEKYESYDSESLFFNGTKLEDTSLRQLKNTGIKIIKRRLNWSKHNYPVGTIIYKIID